MSFSWNSVVELFDELKKELHWSHHKFAELSQRYKFNNKTQLTIYGGPELDDPLTIEAAIAKDAGEPGGDGGAGVVETARGNARLDEHLFRQRRVWSETFDHAPSLPLT